MALKACFALPELCNAALRGHRIWLYEFDVMEIKQYTLHFLMLHCQPPQNRFLSDFFMVHRFTPIYQMCLAHQLWVWLKPELGIGAVECQKAKKASGERKGNSILKGVLCSAHTFRLQLFADVIFFSAKL